MSNDDDAYTVGYRKPPVHTRFEAGKSGNPKGRPKGARNFDTVFEQELTAKVDITENGRRRKISKREAIAKQVVNKAASGDPKFVPIALNEGRRIEDKLATAPSEDMLSSAEDHKVLQSLLARLKDSSIEGESK